MSDTFIFLGPSMSYAEARGILDAEYLPPIRRGDLAMLPSEAQFVGIVDGEFYQNLAVSSKEIVVLLERGVKVFGAGSMGALRAAETHTLGTVGVGEIFQMFRDGVLDGDDEVALVYEPDSYRACSDPLVNIRRVLDLAVSGSVIDMPQRDWLLGEMKACYFPNRSYKSLQLLCPQLRPFFEGAHLPDLKRSDCGLLLHAIQELRANRRAAVDL